jgi:hypothetical protein
MKKVSKKRQLTSKRSPEKKLKAKAKRHKSNDIFIIISENTKNEKFIEMGKLVQSGDVVWSYYIKENNIGYHYYRKK